jgi:hypothetical protein
MSETATSELQRLNDGDLAPGTSLRGHVRDIRGRILLRAGQMIDQASVESARKHAPAGLYGGGDWRDEVVGASGSSASGESCARIMKELSEQHRPGKAFKDRRHERKPWAVPLTVQLEERCTEGIRTRDVEVTSHNISSGGFAFVFNQYVHEGTIVRVQFDTLPRKPRLMGVVRNCVLLNGRQHRVGVQFMESEPTT